MTVQNSTERRLEIPPGLTAEQVETLCLLDDVPPGVAEATIALMPFGSRANLAAHGIIAAVSTDSGAATEIDITPYGAAVIAACAERFGHCDDTDEHPAVRVDRRTALLARWRPQAEAADRKLSRMKAQAHERLEKLRSHPHTSH
jgi:hypothetical protein